MKSTRRFWWFSSLTPTPILRIAQLILCGLFPLGEFCAHAQYTTDREPPGPSSRKTPLVISEIMYHPLVVRSRPNESTEFIEVSNPQPWPENIGGYAIDGSVQYTFPSNTVIAARGSIVVARQPGTIRTNYGIENVLGPWRNANVVRLPLNGGTVA